MYKIHTQEETESEIKELLKHHTLTRAFWEIANKTLFCTTTSDWQRTHSLIQFSRWIMSMLHEDVVFHGLPQEEIKQYISDYKTFRISGITYCRDLEATIEANTQEYDRIFRLDLYDQEMKNLRIHKITQQEKPTPVSIDAFNLLTITPLPTAYYQIRIPQDYMMWRGATKSLNAMEALVILITYKTVDREISNRLKQQIKDFQNGSKNL